MSRSLVVDASVALKWVVTEPGSEQAALLLDEMAAGAVALLAPEHLIGEVANGLRCSEKTRLPSAATVTAVAEALSAGTSFPMTRSPPVRRDRSSRLVSRIVHRIVADRPQLPLSVSE